MWYDDGKARTIQPRNIKSGIVACGFRHGNCWTQLEEIFGEENIDKTKLTSGFLTSRFRFVDRKEGYDVAHQSNQILLISNEREPEWIGRLRSEDLY